VLSQPVDLASLCLKDEAAGGLQEQRAGLEALPHDAEGESYGSAAMYVEDSVPLSSAAEASHGSPPTPPSGFSGMRCRLPSFSELIGEQGLGAPGGSWALMTNCQIWHWERCLGGVVSSFV
jgi:hypothetical protein